MNAKRRATTACSAWSAAPRPAARPAAPGGTFGAGGISGSNLAPFDLYQYGLDASWEIDLWGKVRRSVESADAAITASTETQRDTLVSSLAEVARDYVDLRGAQLREHIANDNLKSHRTRWR